MEENLKFIDLEKAEVEIDLYVSSNIKRQQLSKQNSIVLVLVLAQFALGWRFGE